MESYGKYYTDSLYPFQNGALQLVNALKTPFYLTGGTALSRHYFNHRYSDDLDFFVNQDNRYSDWIQIVFESLTKASQTGAFKIDYQRVIRGENFTQIFLYEEDVFLKLDFVNDIASHFGGFEENLILGRVDGWRNILSNKLTALSRLEIKDFVDLWIVSKNRKFRWRTIFEEAKQKDAGLDPVMIFELIRSIPLKSLDLIKWVHRVDSKSFFHDMSVIANDFIFGGENSLCSEG